MASGRHSIPACVVYPARLVMPAVGCDADRSPGAILKDRALAGRGESVMGLVTPPRVQMQGAAT